jgi:hypothetical protein
VSFGHEELAWAAGFFEGEGSITQSNGRPLLQVRNNDPAPLHRFRRAVQAGKVYGPYTTRTRMSRKPFWQWAATGCDGLDVLRMLSPWLSERRLGQAFDMLAIARGVSEAAADELYLWLRESHKRRIARAIP